MEKIKVKEKEIELVPLKLNDFVEFEKKFGKMRDLNIGESGLDMEQARFMIWRSAKRSVAEVTEEEVGEAIEPTNVVKLSNSIVSTPRPKSEVPLA